MATKVAQVEPTGVAEQDTANIAAAVRQAAGGGKIVLGRGCFVVLDSIALTDGIHLCGKGASTVLQCIRCVESRVRTFVGYGHYDVCVEQPQLFRPGMGVLIDDQAGGGFYATLSVVTAVDGNWLRIAHPLNHDYHPQHNGVVRSLFPPISIVKASNVRVSNLSISGADPENPRLNNCRGAGVYILGSRCVKVDEVRIEGFEGDGIGWQQCLDVVIQDCLVCRCRGNGLHPGSGSVRWVVRGTQSRENQNAGLFYCLRTQYGLVEDSVFADNGECGLSINSHDGHQWIRACQIEGNGGPGIIFPEVAPHAAPNFCRIEDNNLLGNCRKEGGGQIEVNTGVEGLYLLRNRFACEPRNTTRIMPVHLGPTVRGVISDVPGLDGPPNARPCPSLGPAAAPLDSAKHLGISRLQPWAEPFAGVAS